MKKRIFSGIQPSGDLHIGNYLGAIKNWVNLQNEFESIFCIVDLHAITVPQKPEELKRRTLEIAKIYLAAGIDPTKSTIFVQSHIKEHTELSWILNTITGTRELFRMTQFKDKSGISSLEDNIKNLLIKEGYNKETGNIELSLKEENALSKWVEIFSEGALGLNTPLGIFNYPVLMAADILLYDTEVVPVGEDQVQHIELTRTLARRFNKRFGDTFVVPKSFVQEEGMRIMGLDDPSKKMSKSASSEYNYISLLDSPKIIEKKIKKAVTDSGSDITYSNNRPALKNLINIYASFSNKKPSDIEKDYIGKGYADFKTGLTKAILDFIIPFQKKYKSLDNKEVLALLTEGADNVRPIAEKKITEVKNKMGIL